MRRTISAWLGLLACCLLLVACEGGDSSDVTDDGVDGDGAVLSVLDPGVDVADEPAAPSSAEFRPGEDGESLVVSDVVRTDVSGFAQVVWFDGAVARVDAASTYRVTTFEPTPGRAVVVTELDAGRVWHRLRDGVASTYEVSTDVATAAVRGTAFWVGCTTNGPCTFAVLEGTLAVRAGDGSEVELQAGDELTVGDDGTPGAIVPTDPEDAWVVRNAELDTGQGFAPLPDVTSDDEASERTDPVVRDYFVAFGTRTESDRAAMLDASLPGSGAHDFAVYWSSGGALDANSFSQEITITDGVVEACITEGEENAVDEGCVTYGDVVIDGATGLLVDFAANGSPISSSVVLGDGSRDQADGVTIELVAAHLTERLDRLTVVWSTQNEGDDAAELEVRMLLPSGQAVAHAGFTDANVPPGGSVRNGANFPVDQLGGTLQVRLASGTVLEVPIPA